MCIHVTEPQAALNRKVCHSAYSAVQRSWEVFNKHSPKDPYKISKTISHVFSVIVYHLDIYNLGHPPWIGTYWTKKNYFQTTQFKLSVRKVGKLWT